MFLLTVILTLLLASALLYCSNRHQKLLRTPISKRWRKPAFILLLMAVILSFNELTTSAAIFFSGFILMLALMIIPFTSLIKSNKER